jgi:hypothetical protein
MRKSTMRELLQNLTPIEIADLPAHELQLAILNAMAERARTPTGGMANRHQSAAEVINHAAMHGNLPFKEKRELEKRLERNFRRAFDTLERSELIEPASGINGTNGFVVLTPEGQKAAECPVDFELVRTRKRLVPEMLHQKLRGKPYADFANGDPTAAIAEAFKILDIEVQNAGNMPNLFGQNLMLEAFEHAKGPLTDQSESEVMRKALPRLFAGAVGRFRNPSTHTHRTFPDLHEAIEELMIASRLLRILDEPGRKRHP